jgi:phenylalanyl-tRNA synthetase beta chain
MNIKIVDSWLREYLITKASPRDIARGLSLTSVSVDRIEKAGGDFIYDIEVTTNRPDLMSVIAISREAGAVLPQQGIEAKFKEPKSPQVPTADISFPIEIINDPKLVNRILTAVLEVELKPSPKEISQRLEYSNIRSLNNLIDVTNYVMRETGHPCHVFDYDLLKTKKMLIKESKPGEELTTLDGKIYKLKGGDIIAVNDNGEIIDLLGIMGTANSVVQENTKRIMFFIDNLNPKNIRQTSMNLGIRTEAAIINEKGIDPELMDAAFKRGVELYEKIADGKVITKTLDMYPNKPKTRTISVSHEKINRVIGIKIDPTRSCEILNGLGLNAKNQKENIEVFVPTIRVNDVIMDEDIIEEIARVYGYHKLPSVIPTYLNDKNVNFDDNFYFEERIKNALKYWGFTEVYTYSLVSEELYDGPIENGVKLKNPLITDMIYLRNSLIPSLLAVVENNRSEEGLKIFELSNIYLKNERELPTEKLMLAGIIKKQDLNFYEVKGLIEQLMFDLGINNIKFKPREIPGAHIFIGSEKLGYIEILNQNLINFELSFEIILKHANIKKAYKALTKFPPIYEDITFVLNENINTETVIEEIKLQSFLITDVSLKDQFEDAKTFHITYQAQDRNLTNTEITEIRNGIMKSISKKFKAQVK